MARRPTERTRNRSPSDATSLDGDYLEKAGESTEEPQRPAERQTFGSTPSSWMVLSADEHGRQAVLKKLAPGGDTTLGAEDLIRSLQESYQIEHGIDTEAIDQVLKLALAKPDSVLSCNQLVARSTPFIPGENGRAEYTQDLANADLKSAALAHVALKNAELEEVLASDVHGVLVHPGQVLTHLVPPTPGTPGVDIYGKETCKPGAPPPLKAGAHVHQEGDTLVATIYGYLGQLGDELTIAPPIWIPPDAMRASYVHFDLQLSAATPEAAWFNDILAQCGVVYGVDTETIEKLCRAPLASDQKKALTIARGSALIPGEDARVEYSFDPSKSAGKIMPDGSIDFRERNAVIGVTEGQLLGEVKPATKGEPGQNLFGNTESAPDGVDHVFKAGDNVRAEGDPPRAFYAQAAGNAQISGDTLHVKPIYIVSGDVNYETGNIDTPIDVQIGGSVRSGFTVKSGGSITVSGTVEANVVLSAHGDIIVAKGIVGENTTVKARGILAMGNVQTKFIQNASVLAKGNIEVGSYIFNSQVRCGGQIDVHSGGGKRGGSIVGGEIFAASAIGARLCGSESTAGTKIGISPDPALGIKLAKLEKVLDYCDTTLLRLLRTLGLQSIDTQRLKAILRQAPAARKRQLADMIQKLYDISETRDKALAEIETIKEQNEATLAEATISIEGTLFTGVVVQMGQERWGVDKDLKRTCLYRGEEGIENRPL